MSGTLIIAAWSAGTYPVAAAVSDVLSVAVTAHYGTLPLAMPTRLVGTLDNLRRLPPPRVYQQSAPLQ